MTNKKSGLPNVPKNLLGKDSLKNGLPNVPKAWRLSAKGQFFSPDLIIAVIVFILALAFFAISSSSINAQIQVFYEKNMLEEPAHSIMDYLVKEPGVPYDWQNKALGDVNLIGLVDGENMINEYKLNRFIYLLDNNYSFVKEKFAFGKYDFSLELIDTNGSVILSGGTVIQDYTMKLGYSRLVYFEDRQVTLRGVFSYAR